MAAPFLLARGRVVAEAAITTELAEGERAAAAASVGAGAKMLVSQYGQTLMDVATTTPLRRDGANGLAC